MARWKIDGVVNNVVAVQRVDVVGNACASEGVVLPSIGILEQALEVEGRARRRGEACKGGELLPRSQLIWAA